MWITWRCAKWSEENGYLFHFRCLAFSRNVGAMIHYMVSLLWQHAASIYAMKRRDIAWQNSPTAELQVWNADNESFIWSFTESRKLPKCEFVVIGDTGSCSDNLRYHQWRQSWQHDNSWPSVFNFAKILQLTHWDRVTPICICKLIIIGSDNSLSPGGHQAILWTIAGILLIGPWEITSVKFQSKFINFH